MSYTQQTRLPIEEIMKGEAEIGADSPIWYSTFQDDVWRYVLNTEPLYKGEESATINWPTFLDTNKHQGKRTKYKRCLTKNMVHELKVTAFIYAHYPSLLNNTKTNKTTLDGKTVKGRVSELVKIGSQCVTYGKENGYYIDSFSDISFDILKINAPMFGGRVSHLKRALRLITDNVIQKNLPQPLQLSLKDINSKSIPWREKALKEGIKNLSDAQFLFLLNYCKRAIAEFKLLMEFDIHDDDIRNYASSDVTDRFGNIKVQLEEHLWGEGKALSKHYKKKYGYTAGEINELYSNAHKASMLIVLLLTGMRDTEFSLLTVGSLRTSPTDGLKYLYSKVVKQENEAKPEEVDKWLVIPLIQDAYDILLYACEKSGNNYLFSSPYKVVRSGGQGYSTLNSTFNRFIKKIDKNDLFKHHTFSVHQCRETLAYQLAKHNVGLPFISKQLKHFHNRFNRLPNEVTAGYGSYKSNLLLTIQSKTTLAREEVLNDLYGENKLFAGGGGEAHKARIDAWFKGNGLYGENRALYIKKLANSNISLMTTSIGICTYNFIKNENGEAPPPCFGDYSCDPDCPNHVISEGCVNALKNRKFFADKQVITGQDHLSIDVWSKLSNQLEKHVSKFEREQGEK